MANVNGTDHLKPVPDNDDIKASPDDTQDIKTNTETNANTNDANNGEANIINQIKQFGFNEDEIRFALDSVINKNDINAVMDLIYVQRANINTDDQKINNDKTSNAANTVDERCNNVIHQLILFGFEESEIGVAMSEAQDKYDVNQVMDILYTKRETAQKVTQKQKAETEKHQHDLRRLVSFGFDEELALTALQTANNDFDTAVQQLTTATTANNLFYDDLMVDISNNKLIILKNLAQNATKYDRKILGYTFALSSNARYDDRQQLTPDEVCADNGFYIAQFETFDHTHFIIPFATNASNAKLINIYVQFQQHYEFVLFKRFNVHNSQNKVDYLLDLLEIYPYTINSAKVFLNRININLSENDILNIKNNHKIFHFSPLWRKEHGKHVSDTLVMHRLVQDLHIMQLSDEMKMLSSEYIPVIDENEDDVALIFGYIKNMQKILKIPNSVIALIFCYYQYCIIRGNDLSIINPKEKICTTAGSPHHEIAYIIISKALTSGICRFTIKCVIAAQTALSIGVITHPYRNIAKNKYIFDGAECGESFQMYLSNETGYDNAIYHFKDGRALTQQTLALQPDVIHKHGAIIEIEIDFITNQLSFILNFERCGTPIQLQPRNDTPYFAAFAYDCNDKHFAKDGPPQYEYNLQLSAEMKQEIQENYNVNISAIPTKEIYDDEAKRNVESYADDEKANLNMSFKLQRLVSFGFDEELAYNALVRKANDVDEAIQFLTDTNPADSPFYNELVIEHNKVVLLKGMERVSDTEVLNYKFAISWNQLLNENDKLKYNDICNDNCCDIYQFNSIEDVHFIIPFGVRPETINIYVQFASKYDFILFKRFNIYDQSLDDSTFDRIDYVLHVLELFKPKIKDSNSFFNRINVELKAKDMTLIKDNNRLYHFSPMWRKEDHTKVSNKLVIHRLFEELNINELSSEIEMLSSNHISLSFDAEEDEWKLTFGFMREMESALSVTIPIEIIKLMYKYYQYCIIRGNDLAIINPKEKIFTTSGDAGNEYTYVMISEQMTKGVYKFDVKYLVSSHGISSIGIITNADVHIAKSDFLFNSGECGESHQMCLCRGKHSMIYHYLNGIKLDEQQIGQNAISQKDTVIEMEINFDVCLIQFYCNFERCGEAIPIQPNTPYFAAFAYGCCNGGFVHQGPPQYQYSWNIH